MKTKFISLCLALAMLLSLASPVLALDTGSEPVLTESVETIETAPVASDDALDGISEDMPAQDEEIPPVIEEIDPSLVEKVYANKEPKDINKRMKTPVVSESGNVSVASVAEDIQVLSADEQAVEQYGMDADRRKMLHDALTSMDSEQLDAAIALFDKLTLDEVIDFFVVLGDSSWDEVAVVFEDLLEMCDGMTADESAAAIRELIEWRKSVSTYSTYTWNGSSGTVTTWSTGTHTIYGNVGSYSSQYTTNSETVRSPSVARNGYSTGTYGTYNVTLVGAFNVQAQGIPAIHVRSGATLNLTIQSSPNVQFLYGTGSDGSSVSTTHPGDYYNGKESFRYSTIESVGGFAGIQVETGGTLNIMSSKGRITIRGGMDQYDAGAGIGGAAKANNGTININAGELNLYTYGGNAPYYGAAGIGSGARSTLASNISISSGTIYAYGSKGAHVSAAGIGGGTMSSASNITISGGNVTAQAGDGNNGGAGIGSGGNGYAPGDTWYYARNITISGAATVRADGRNMGAGIGGGGYSYADNIRIQSNSSGNPSVTAYSGNYGAGVGGGYYGYGANITITGLNASSVPTLYVHGSSYGAGIGGGYEAGGYNIDINYASISGYAELGAVIGSGYNFRPYSASVGQRYTSTLYNTTGLVNTAYALTNIKISNSSIGPNSLSGSVYTNRGAVIGSGYSSYGSNTSQLASMNILLSNTDVSGYGNSYDGNSNASVAIGVGPNGDYVDAYISITGGSIDVYSNYGTAIGAGGNVDYGKVTCSISGCEKLRARNTSYANPNGNCYSGAGIGFGQSSGHCTGTFTISNCSDVEFGTDAGAGLGFGSRSSNNNATFTVSNCSEVNTYASWQGSAIGSGCSSQSNTGVFTFTDCSGIRATVNSYYSCGIGASYYANGNHITANFTRCGDIATRSNLYATGIGLSSNTYNNTVSVAINNCGDVSANGNATCGAVGIGIAQSAYNNNLDIDITNSGSITVALTGQNAYGSNVSDSFGGAAIGIGGKAYRNTMTLDVVNCGDVTATSEDNYSSGIGTGANAYGNKLTVNFSANDAGEADSYTIGCGPDGTGIGTGYHNYVESNSSNATNWPSEVNIAIRNIRELTINGKGGDYSVGVGVGGYTANSHAVSENIPFKSTVSLVNTSGKGQFPVNISNVGTGIGTGEESSGAVYADVDFGYAGNIDVTVRNVGIGVGIGCSGGVQTDLDIANCGNITATASFAGIGIGSNVRDDCVTSIDITSCGNVSATATGSNCTGIGSCAGCYGLGLVTDINIVQCGNITAKSLGNGVAIGAGNGGGNGVGEEMNITIDRCGSVTANGNSNSNASSAGAGIGVGYGYSDCGTNGKIGIRIMNCSGVTATGSRDGAGIGTGGNVSGTIPLTITIQGTPTVTASARANAPGIGLGRSNTGAGSKGTISITGATITSTSTGSAAIGAGNNCQNGSVKLNFTNDTFTSSTKSSDGPALGLGRGCKSNVTVDATLKGCTGNFVGTGHSAGIGQGLENSNSVMLLTIDGGTIKGYGSNGGAGIGTGPVNALCTLVLNGKNGATIEGYGSESLEDELSVVGSTGNTVLDNLAAGRIMGAGAGIGGSNGTQILSITFDGCANVKGCGVSNDTVGSAGIGGGSSGDGGEITLKNSTVSAYAGLASDVIIITPHNARGAGIGGGSRGEGGTVTIDGGEVYVVGGRFDAAGIGGGAGASEHGTLTLQNNPDLTVLSSANYQLAAPGEVTTTGTKLIQATLFELKTDDITYRVQTQDAGKDTKDVVLLANYGGFSVTVDPTTANGSNYEVYMDTTKNGSPITYKMATPYAVEEFPLTTSEAYAAELLTIIDFYTVKFNTNGGSTVADQSVRINNMVELPETNPTKTNYKFAGWYKDAELTELYDFSSIVTEDMTLYARWIESDKAVYCVQHWRQTLDNTYILSSEQYLDGYVGETVSAETIDVEGFSPINTDGTKLSGILPATGTLKLAIYYNRNMVTVEFKNIDSLVGQAEGVTSVSAMYGSTIVPPKAEKAGWVFDYYTKVNEDGEQVALLPARIETLGDTLYANWTLKEGVKYIVCHYQQQLDGTYTEVLKEYFAAPKAGATITAERPEYPGFHVNTYITDGTGTGIASEAGDTVLRVYYDRNTITVNLVDGYGLPDAFVKRTSGEAANIPTPSRVGYRFDGWFKADGAKLSDSARIDDCGETLTAHWTAVPTTAYSVRYYLQNPAGSYKVDRIDDLQGETDSTVNAQVLVYEGYTLNTERSRTSGTVSGDGSLTLSLFYDTKAYDVSFDTNGGNSISKQTGIPYGGTVVRPADPVKAGYDFIGWYTDAGCNIPFSFSETVKGNMTLYAKYLPKNNTPYTVQYWFEADGVYEMRDELTLSGTTDTRVSAEVRYYPGYQESLTASGRVTSGVITADGKLVLKVYYDRLTATVEFDSNGGTEVNSQVVKIDGHAEEPAAPTMTGYTFVGWYSNAGLTKAFDFDNTAITKDITLYAKWQANANTQYTVKHYFEAADGSGAYVEDSTATLTGVTGMTVEAPILDRAGFHENRTHADRKTVGEILADGSLVLKVFYDRDSYRVSFVTNCEANIASQQVKFGSTATEPSEPSRDGYDFVGWFSDTSLTDEYDFSTKPDKDITLYAKWQAWDAVEYTTEYYQQGLDGSYELADTVTQSDAAGAKVNAIIKTYDGFVENTTHASRLVSATLERNISVTLRVYYDRQQYTVKYETNGIGEDVADKTVMFGGTAEEIELAQIGYTFGGWFSNASLTKAYDFNSEVVSDITLYAKWERIEVSYTTEHYFEALDGSYVMDSDLTETATGYVGDEAKAVVGEFNGFELNAGSSTLTAALTETGSIVLKVYYARQNVNVKFDAAFTLTGTHSGENSTVKYGSTVSTDVTPGDIGYDEIPVIDGRPYQFAGWYKDSAFSEVAPETDTVYENTTYYAKWTPYAIVKYETNSDTDIADKAVAPGAVAEAPTLTRDGYDFGGWFVNASLTKAYEGEALYSDITLYAKWIPWEAVEYTTEYYLESLTGGYTLANTTTSSDAVGAEVQAVIAEYPGFVENKLHSDRVVSGVLNKVNPLVLKVYYNRQMMTVKYETNGAGDVADKTVKYGATAEKITLTRPGYDFNGWYSNASLTKAYDFKTPVTETTILYAKWTAQGSTLYKVQYYTEAEDGYELHHEVEKTAATGETVFADIVDITGYEHITGVDGEKLVGVVNENGTLVLKVYYKAISHEVRFEVNGGTDVESITVAHNGKISAPETTREGYTFAGWYTNASLTQAYDFDSEIKRDITLYAKWESNGATNYTIEYFFETLDGGYEKKSETRTAATGDLIEAIPVEYAGFSYEAGNTGNKLIGNVEADGSLVLSIYYTRNTYTVSFDALGGTEVDAQSVKYNATATEPEVPAKEGCIFICWLDGEGNRFDFATPIEGDVSLFAQWSNADNIGYSVRHYFQNASRTGYVLDDEATQYLTGKGGEEVTAEAGTFYGFEENTVHENRVASGEVLPDGSLMLKLYYDRVAFTVDFESNGGSEVEPVTAIYETTITEPVVPEKTGYDFEGWYTDSVFANAFDFDTEITEDITLYAKWVPSDGVTYTVEYYQQTVDGTDYEMVSDAVFAGVTGEEVEATVADIPVGFELNAEAADAVMTGIVEADGSLVLKVYFDRLSYILTFEPDNGEEATSRDVLFGDTLGELESVEKTGYTFVNWISDSGKAWFSDDTMPASDLTLTAKWSESFMTKYTTEYYQEQLDGSYELVDSTEATALTNSVVSAHIPSYTGFVENAEHADRRIIGIVDADGSLVLKVFYDRIRYTVSFECNGGSEVEDQIVALGSVAASVEPERVGYDFVGWFSDASLTRLYDFTSEITKDTVLYAKWKAHGDTEYTVQYFLQNVDDPDSYTLDNTVTEYGTSGSVVHARAIEYLGFHQNTAHPNSIILGEVAADGSLLLCVYYDRDDVVVTFDVNGGDRIDPMRVPFYNTICDTVATRTGYVFEGWYADKDLRVEFDPATPITVAMTLYAKWSCATDTKYKVEHYQQQKLEDGKTEYVLVDTDEFEGVTESSVTAVDKSRTYEGFYWNRYRNVAEQSGIVKPDGSLVLKLYYDIPSPYTGGGGSTAPAKETVSVVFDTDGGTAVPTQAIPYGGYATQPANPLKPGYVFKGWTLNGSVFDFGKAVKDDIILTAEWEYRGVKTLMNVADHMAYISGYPDGTVKPEGNITRAEVAMIFYRLLREDVRAEYKTSSVSFTDVPSSDWYTTAVATLSRMNILNGYSDGTFRPNVPITRAEFAAICAKMDAQSAGNKVFTDVSAEHWAYGFIASASAKGWVSGYPDGTFRPDAHITRAETMSLVNRMLGRASLTVDSLTADAKAWPDNDASAWYYLAVMEATNGHEYSVPNGSEVWSKLKEFTFES